MNLSIPNSRIRIWLKLVEERDWVKTTFNRKHEINYTISNELIQYINKEIENQKHRITDDMVSE